MSLGRAMALSSGVVEGVASAVTILQVAASVGVDMPTSCFRRRGCRGRAESIADMGRMPLSRPQKMDGWKIELAQTRAHPGGSP